MKEKLLKVFKTLKFTSWTLTQVEFQTIKIQFFLGKIPNSDKSGSIDGQAPTHIYCLMIRNPPLCST